MDNKVNLTPPQSRSGKGRILLEMEAEATFNRIARTTMKQWDRDEFKKTHPTLMKAIVNAMITFKESYE